MSLISRALVLSVATLWGAQGAAAQAVLAGIGENSGSLPPEYAWQYSVRFFDDGSVTTRYCKGYAKDGPTCAQRSDRLSPAKMAKLTAALAPAIADFAANPAGDDPMPPVGGGSTAGFLKDPATGKDLTLPPFPLATDAARVTSAIEMLRSFIPKRAVKSVEKRAVVPE